ncbi:hypothetical protein AgCh_021267 [Apium graveolens]
MAWMVKKLGESNRGMTFNLEDVCVMVSSDQEENGALSGFGKTNMARKMANIIGCEVISLESYHRSKQVKDFKYEDFSSLDLTWLSKDSPIRVPAEQFLILRAFDAPPIVIDLALIVIGNNTLLKKPTSASYSYFSDDGSHDSEAAADDSNHFPKENSVFIFIILEATEPLDVPAGEKEG